MNRKYDLIRLTAALAIAGLSNLCDPSVPMPEPKLKNAHDLERIRKAAERRQRRAAKKGGAQ